MIDVERRAGYDLEAAAILLIESDGTETEVEDEIREEQNTSFIQGKAVHTFEELTAILEYMPAGYESDEEAPAKGVEDEDEDDNEEDDEEYESKERDHIKL